MSGRLSWEMVAEAEGRIRGLVHRTPVLTSRLLDERCGFSVFLKAENLQKTGSFKARGALNAVKLLQERQGSALKGVLTHSSGNHGQALAWAAAAAQIPATVVVPDNAPKIKQEAIRSYGARIVRCPPTFEGRVSTAARLEQEEGLTLVHAHDDLDVMAGQGVLAKELLEETPPLDAILVEVGGGGMAAGVAVWTKHVSPATKIFCVVAGGKELEPSLRAGRPLWTTPPRLLDTVADGIRPDRLGGHCFPPVAEHCEPDVLSVSESEVVAGMRWGWERLKLVVEAATGAGLAALWQPRLRELLGPGPKRVGLVLCGGNVDLDNLPWL